MRGRNTKLYLVAGGLLAAPAAHPFLIPALGPPSHLLWWLHVAVFTLRIPIAVVPASSRPRRGAVPA